MKNTIIILAALAFAAPASAQVCEQPIKFLQLVKSGDSFRKTCEAGEGAYSREQGLHICASNNGKETSSLMMEFKGGVAVAAGVGINPAASALATLLLADCVASYGKDFESIQIGDLVGAQWTLPQYRVRLTFDGETVVVRADRLGKQL